MNSYEDLKQSQLKDAMNREAHGYEPDHIMVTYTPEEYAQMQRVATEEPYVLSEMTIDSFPITLLGSTAPLLTHDLSVDAFSSYMNKNIVEIYIEAVKRALAKAEEDEYLPEQIEAELSIQKTLADALQAALDYYKEEYRSDLEIYNTTENYMAKSELGADLRLTTAIVDKIDSTIKYNESFGDYLRSLLSQDFGTR